MSGDKVTSLNDSLARMVAAALPIVEIFDVGVSHRDISLPTVVGIMASESEEAVEQFRLSQFHYRDVEQVILVILYALVFIVGVLGNILILIWMKMGFVRKTSSSGCSTTPRTSSTGRTSLFDLFLVNLCISDHLVLFSCCPLMMYNKITSLWFLGPVACTLLHYIQGKKSFIFQA